MTSNEQADPTDNSWVEELIRLARSFVAAEAYCSSKQLANAADERNALVRHAIESPHSDHLRIQNAKLADQLRNARHDLSSCRQESAEHLKTLRATHAQLQQSLDKAEAFKAELTSVRVGNVELNERYNRALRHLHDLGRNPETSFVVDGRPQHIEIVEQLKSLRGGTLRAVSREVLQFREKLSPSAASSADQTKAGMWQVMGAVSGGLPAILGELRARPDVDLTFTSLIAEQVAKTVGECMNVARDQWPPALQQIVKQLSVECADVLAKILAAQPSGDFLVPAGGEAFDPIYHEVLPGMPDSGRVTATVFPGYVLDYAMDTGARVILKASVTTTTGD